MTVELTPALRLKLGKLCHTNAKHEALKAKTKLPTDWDLITEVHSHLLRKQGGRKRV